MTHSGSKVAVGAELLSNGGPLEPRIKQSEDDVAKGTGTMLLHRHYSEPLKYLCAVKYKEGELEAAKKFFKRACETLRDESGATDSGQKPEASMALGEIRVRCENNAAMVHLKLGSLSEALNHCNEVLSIDPKNSKVHIQSGYPD